MLLCLVAMPHEEAAACEALGTFEEEILAPSEHQVAVTDNLLVARAGVGPIAASYVTGIICERFPISSIVLLGVGGALDPRLRLGDVVIAEHVVQHDAQYIADDRVAEIPPGSDYLSHPENNKPNPRMPTDPSLTRTVCDVFPEAYRGLFLSGSSFRGTRDTKAQLAERWPDALMVDMEAAGVAYVARARGLPFAVTKTVADTLGAAERSMTDEYLGFIDAASQRSARFVAHARQVSNSSPHELA